MANQAKEGEIKWRKTAGTLKLRDGTVVGPGGTFMARPEDIPKVFRDTILPVNPEELLDPAMVLAPIKPQIPNYTIKSCGPGRYNVLDSQGKPVNEKSMTLADAERLMENLG